MLLFADNFSGYGTLATGRTNMLAGVWAEVAAAVGDDTWPVSTNARGLGVNSLATAVTGTGVTRFVVPGTPTQLIAGGAFMIAALPSAVSGMWFLQPRDGSNLAQCTVTCTPTGKMEVRNGGVTGTVIADSGSLTPVIAGSYQFIEAFFNIADSGAVEVRVDGVTVINASGIDTKGSANVGCGLMAISALLSASGMGTGDMSTTDIYCLDLTGSQCNDFLGDTQWLDLAPDADSTPSDWVRSSGSADFDMVKEAIPDADSTYVAATTLGQRERFGFANLPATVSEVVAVITKPMARKTDAGSCNMRSTIVSGVGSPFSTANGTDRAITQTYTYYRDIFEVDPATGIAWVPSSVNAIHADVTKTV